MPKFYFHLCSSGDVVRDDEGEDLRDMDAAHAAAVCRLRELVGEGERHENAPYILIEREDGKAKLIVAAAEAFAAPAAEDQSPS